MPLSLLKTLNAEENSRISLNLGILSRDRLQFSEFVIHAKQDIMEKGFGADVRASRSNAGGITF